MPQIGGHLAVPAWAVSINHFSRSALHPVVPCVVPVAPLVWSVRLGVCSTLGLLIE